MAKQDSVLQFTGTIDNLSFYKTRKGGFSVRRKTGVSPDRIANDPQFASLRANGREFAQAGRAGKLIRTAFNGPMKGIADPDVSNRLAKRCKAIIRTDEINEPGSRQLIEGQLSTLQNFEFNEKSPFDTSFLPQITHVFDRAAGTATISIPALNAIKHIQPPSNATHFRLRAATAAVNFEAFKYVSGEQVTELMTLNNADIAAFTISAPLPPASDDVLLLTLSIEFVKVNGNFEIEVLNYEYNAMRLVGVNTLV